MWVYDSSTPICANDGCAINGAFDPSQSSTYETISPASDAVFNQSYGTDQDVDYYAGSYVADTVQIGGATLENFQFGLVNDEFGDHGIQEAGQPGLAGLLGIGFNKGENSYVDSAENPYTYPNLPQALYEAKLINTIAYSFYASDTDESGSGGQLLFGGVDTAKFSGSLGTMDTYYDSTGLARLLVPLTGFSVSNGSSTTSFLKSTNAALIDSGTEGLFLPSAIYSDILEQFGAIFDDSSQDYLVPCSSRNGNVSVTVSFGSKDIIIPASDLILPEGYGEYFTFNNETSLVDGEPYCWINMDVNDESADSDFILLGSSLFRAAYIVFDLSGNRISIAQKIDTTDSNIVEITADESQKAILPSATFVSYSVPVPSGLGATLIVTTAGALPTEDPSDYPQFPEVSASAITGTLESTTSGSESTSTSGSSPGSGSGVGSGSGSGSGSGGQQSSASHSFNSPVSEALLIQSSLAIVLACLGGALIF
jgi:hypothetical protein